MQLTAFVASLALISANLSPAEQWWLEELGPEVGQTLGGQGVVVAVIDTGIDASHPDLIDVVVGGADFSGVGTPDGLTPVGSSPFHGTMVASLISGQGKQSGGVIGVAPGAKLLSVSVGLGVAGSDTDTQIAAAVNWAVDQGVDVINLSLSRNSSSWPKSWDEAFLNAFENDVVVVAASGNDITGNSQPGAPATIPGVLSVTGLDSSFEGRQVAGSSGLGVALSAPGFELYGSYPGGKIAKWSGSSAAAPLVSGLVAIMRQQDPEASANDIIFRLISTASDFGEVGFDQTYGFGFPNLTAALASDLTASTNPLGQLDYWIELYRGSLETDSQDASFVLPQTPEQVLGVPGPVTESNSLSSQAGWYQNPLLYFLLSPVALLLWLALRKRRSEGQGRKDESI